MNTETRDFQVSFPFHPLADRLSNSAASKPSKYPPEQPTQPEQDTHPEQDIHCVQDIYSGQEIHPDPDHCTQPDHGAYPDHGAHSEHGTHSEHDAQSQRDTLSISPSSINADANWRRKRMKLRFTGKKTVGDNRLEESNEQAAPEV